MTDPGYQLKQGSAHQLQDLSLPRVAKSHNPVGRQCRARLNNHSVCQGGICHCSQEVLRLFPVIDHGEGHTAVRARRLPLHGGYQRGDNWTAAATGSHLEPQDKNLHVFTNKLFRITHQTSGI
ncbi:uncharacterized protein LOC135110554 isoform X2 [Scylla paramamosain]|uniref:uncharacterized protein LOC135110554 isoform X2 n=1 Tax=Scylla paramamosain TaxID=85552 RepID=UPI0030833A28